LLLAVLGKHAGDHLFRELVVIQQRGAFPADEALRVNDQHVWDAFHFDGFVGAHFGLPGRWSVPSSVMV
jgi:hypothetical protein